MPVQPVVIYPDVRLKSVAEPCGQVGPDEREIATDLVDTMRAHPKCVGLAAPQIGVMKRIVVVDVTGHPKASQSMGLIVVFDPVVREQEGGELGREGCLSLPGLTANVKRATRIHLEGLGSEGEMHIDTTGFEARALQHEVDHLDGILILDRAASPSEIFRRVK